MNRIVWWVRARSGSARHGSPPVLPRSRSLRLMHLDHTRATRLGARTGTDASALACPTGSARRPARSGAAAVIRCDRPKHAPCRGWGFLRSWAMGTGRESTRSSMGGEEQPGARLRPPTGARARAPRRSGDARQFRTRLRSSRLRAASTRSVQRLSWRRSDSLPRDWEIDCADPRAKRRGP